MFVMVLWAAIAVAIAVLAAAARAIAEGLLRPRRVTITRPAGHTVLGEPRTKRRRR